jgi:DNA-binding IclR family transcriptional regulator
LGILDKDKVVYIEKMDVVSSVRMYSQIGLRMHAYCSSLENACCLIIPKEELNGIMKDSSFFRFTKNTIGSIEELHKEMAKVRKNGWAIDNEEFEIGHRCIEHRFTIIKEISSQRQRVGATNLLKDDRIEPVAEYVRNVAMELSRSMGYIPD